MANQQQQETEAANENNLSLLNQEEDDNEEINESTSEAASDSEEDAEEESSSTVESEDDNEPHEHLDENDEDNDQEQEMYQEYLHLAKEIEEQNAIISNLKTLLCNLKCQQCLTRNDAKECRRLEICQQQEHIKLRYMINRAIQLQNFGSRRHYDELKWEITDIEQENFLYGSQMNLMQCPNSPRACLQADTDSDDDDYDFE